MSARIERNVPVERNKIEQVVVNFDAERLKAPFLLRCGALLIDYIFVVCIPIISLIVSRLMSIPDAKLLNNEFTNVGWLLMLLVALTNLIIFPLFSGQSIGKMLTGLRIVSKDGKEPSFKQLLLRQFIGYPLTILTLGLGFLFAALNEKGRALQDFVGNTIVIYGKKQILK